MEYICLQRWCPVVICRYFLIKNVSRLLPKTFDLFYSQLSTKHEIDILGVNYEFASVRISFYAYFYEDFSWLCAVCFTLFLIRLQVKVSHVLDKRGTWREYVLEWQLCTVFPVSKMKIREPLGQVRVSTVYKRGFLSICSVRSLCAVREISQPGLVIDFFLPCAEVWGWEWSVRCYGCASGLYCSASIFNLFSLTNVVSVWVFPCYYFGVVVV